MSIRMLLAFRVLATLAVLAMLVQQAEATLVTVGGSEVVFDSGGYEGETAGSLPASPVVGTYQTNDADGVTAATGVSPATSGPTGAFLGSNYLSINRTTAGASSNSWLTSEFARAIDPATESFTVELAVWGTDLDTVHFGMSVGGDAADGTGSSTNEVLSSFGYNANMASFVSFSSSGSVALPVATAAWNAGEWNSVVYSWDTTTATLSVNSSTPEAIVNQTDNPATITQFHARANSSGSHIHFDSIPEPGTLSLISLASLLVFGSRRHKREQPVLE